MIVCKRINHPQGFGVPHPWAFVPLNDLVDRLDALIDEVLRPAVRVEHAGRAQVQADVVVSVAKTSPNLTGRASRLAAEAVGGADDLAGLHAAAGEQGAADSCGQWSRPASLLMRGVRPNSPQTTTETSLSRPRSCRSSTRAETRLVEQRHVLAALDEVLAVRPCQSQRLKFSVTHAGAGLDQPAGEAEVADHARGAVVARTAGRRRRSGRARRGSSLRQVERLDELATR